MRTNGSSKQNIIFTRISKLRSISQDNKNKKQYNSANEASISHEFSYYISYNYPYLIADNFIFEALKEC